MGLLKKLRKLIIDESPKRTPDHMPESVPDASQFGQQREEVVLTSRADFQSVERPKRKKRRAQLTRKNLYMVGCVNLDDPRSYRPSRLARNPIHNEEIVYVVNGQLFRTEFVLDAWSSYRCYSLEEPFFIVIHRNKITFEERFFIEVVFSKCDYFQGLVLKTGEHKYELMRLRGISV